MSKPGAMMISVDAPNHYEVLGVAKDATPDEIRAAHRRLVHQVHTDKGGTDALFRQVQAAYEALTVEERQGHAVILAGASWPVKPGGGVIAPFTQPRPSPSQLSVIHSPEQRAS